MEDVLDTYEVLIVGGGVAGLTAGVYTGRASLDTLIVNAGEPIVTRNAHLENVPGFPAGVNPRLFLDMLRSQATRTGVDRRGGRVVTLERDHADGGERFVATVEREEADATTGSGSEVPDPDRYRVAAERVIAASWSDADYLDPLDVKIRDADSKRYVDDDGLGRTNVGGVYAAGRLSERYHQAAIAAGHGAEVATTVIHDSSVPFYRRNRPSASGRTEIEDFRDDENLRFSNHLTPRRFTTTGSFPRATSPIAAGTFRRDARS